MTLLTVWADDDPGAALIETRELGRIRDILAAREVRFERWEVLDLPVEPTSNEVIDAYRERVDAVIARQGYIFVDAKQLTPSDTPEWREEAAHARRMFLSEHTHDDDEDRFFARGSGVFYLHIEGQVLAVLCEAGDLLSVPAGTRHWFDMGSRPHYVSIRFFHDTDGWVGNFLPDSIADRFPPMDVLVAGSPVPGLGSDRGAALQSSPAPPLPRHDTK